MKKLIVTAKVREGDDSFNEMFRRGMGEDTSYSEHEWTLNASLPDDVALDDIKAAVSALRDQLTPSDPYCMACDTRHAMQRSCTVSVSA